MRRNITTGVAATTLIGAATLVAAVLVGGPPSGATPGYNVRTLHFAVTAGPAGHTESCDVVGDLYMPAAAGPKHRVPAILSTNGFGGSKDDQAGLGKAFAARGFAVLSYSGLGFGGSGCKITLDDPDYDGRAASQLVSFLGGAPGIAFTDAKHTDPVPPLQVVRLDHTDHAGKHVAHDPRVGMIGGSYGGEIQFATAAVDPRVDTIVPLITWNDLSYSLAPNNTARTTGVSSSTPGAVKLTWGLLFSADGALAGAQNAQGDPARLYGCPNFANFVCTALATGATTGYFTPPTVAALRHASVASYLPKITVPVLLIQGEDDTLFNLNEAAATYTALRQQGTPVKMIWQSWGHSNSTPAPGEIDLANPQPASQYETGRVLAWFQHYLLGQSTSTGPQFSYFRNWVGYTGNAAPAYAASSSYPVGTPTTWYLSGGKSLVTSPGSATTGRQTLVTPPAGAPTGFDPVDVLGSFAPSGKNDRDLDATGTAAAWTGAALSAPVDVVGSPRLTVRLNAPAAALSEHSGPAGQLVLFVKIADVSPNGKAELINGLVAPIRIPDVGKPVRVTLPGIVHRFAAGHRIRLTISGGSVNYRGGVLPTPVVVQGGAGQVLTLPLTG